MSNLVEYSLLIHIIRYRPSADREVLQSNSACFAQSRDEHGLGSPKGWVHPRVGLGRVRYVKTTVFVHRSDYNHKVTYRFSDSSDKIYSLILLHRFILDSTGIGSVLILLCCFLYSRYNMSIGSMQLRVRLVAWLSLVEFFTSRWVGFGWVKENGPTPTSDPE